MTGRKVLVTGGAGFIGSHLVAALVERGHQVRVLDVLDPQVHGRRREGPFSISGAEMVRGDILDSSALARALQGIEVVFHQAAAVGVGQSMYEAVSYTRMNCVGTAQLMEQVAGRDSKVEKMVVASSMSVYGEGSYQCAACGPVSPGLRSEERMGAGKWEVPCPSCGKDLSSVPTSEEKAMAPTSVYAVTKRTQEETVLVMGRAYKIPTVALRYFNVYGPGQSLSNPYTGVMAIFSSRILNGHRPILFEDGNQSRDFVHVSDVVQANLLAMESSAGDFDVFNVGTGKRTPLSSLAAGLKKRLSPDLNLDAQVTGNFRAGDIRHCYADITKIRTRLGYEPRVLLEDGYADLAQWARSQTAEDRFEEASQELQARGLVLGNPIPSSE